MNDIIFLLSQLAALLAWVFFAYSYHAKRENKILYLQIISSIFYCVSYLLGGATTGLLISLFETIKEYGCYKSDKDKYIFIFTIPVYILIGLVSEGGFYALVPIVASIIDGYGMLRNNKIMVICGIVSNFMWLFYDLYYLEYVTAIGDALLVISNLTIVAVWGIKYYFTRGIKVESNKPITDKILSDIEKLDQENYDFEYRWTLDKMKEIYNKEKDSYILIKDKKKLIGYINILNLNNEVYSNIITSDSMLADSDSNNIENYNKRSKLYLNMNSVVLKREYNNKKMLKRVEKNINLYVNRKVRSGYKVSAVFIYVVNELEEQIATDLGFKKVKNITNECFLYQKEYV